MYMFPKSKIINLLFSTLLKVILASLIVHVTLCILPSKEKPLYRLISFPGKAVDRKKGYNKLGLNWNFNRIFYLQISLDLHHPDTGTQGLPILPSDFLPAE